MTHQIIHEKISKQEDKSLSVVAKELIEDALEKHEDFLLSEMAMKRENKSKKTVLHDKAWKQALRDCIRTGDLDVFRDVLASLSKNCRGKVKKLTKSLI